VALVSTLTSACRAQREAAAAAAADAEASRQRRQQEAAARMAALSEPPAGVPDTSLVRVRLPSGSNFQRRYILQGSVMLFPSCSGSMSFCACILAVMQCVQAATNSQALS
jgi:hypothetical protein